MDVAADPPCSVSLTWIFNSFLSLGPWSQVFDRFGLQTKLALAIGHLAFDFLWSRVSKLTIIPLHDEPSTARERLQSVSDLPVWYSTGNPGASSVDATIGLAVRKL